MPHKFKIGDVVNYRPRDRVLSTVRGTYIVTGLKPALDGQPSEYRKRRREVEDGDGHHVDSLKSPPQQHSRLEFEEVRRALAKLLPDQREALILVGASGFSYEEAAAVCDCAAGTIKSRVHRARKRLAELLSIDSADMFGQDHTTRAILTAGGRG